MLPQDTTTLIRIEVSPKDSAIPVDSFLKVLSSSVSILKSIDIETSETHRQTVRWKILRASMNSPLDLSIVGVSTNPARVGQITAYYLDGLENLENDHQTAPRYFSPGSLTKAKNIVSVLNDGVRGVKFSQGARVVTPTQRIAAAVDALKAKEGKCAFGTLEGILETLTNRGSIQTVLRDRLTGYQIQCYFDPRYIPELGAAWTKRVKVYGEIRYGKFGHPRCINVDGGIQVLPGNNELPQANDIEGTNITGGVESSQYIAGLRDE